MKILICDDSMFVRKKMRDAVVKAGVTDIVEASDGQQAVEKYKAEKPDLCFMDIIMPVKTGVDALKEIRAFDKDAKVIMASSVGTQANLKEAIVAGAYDFLQKPIDDAAVKKIIDKIKG
ncbi:MAG: response regulator [Oscillospiraceae bacterium]